MTALRVGTGFAGRIATFFTTWWKVGLALLLGLSLGAVGGYLKGHSAGKQAAVNASQKASITTQEEATESRNQGDVERRDDDVRIGREKEARDEAIKNAGDAGRSPSAASNAANCRRLHAAGRDTSRIPACSGPSAGDQARPR